MFWLAAAVLVTASVHAEWPEWRGPIWDGIARGFELPKRGGISDPSLEEGGRLRVCVIGDVWRCRLTVNETDIDRVLGEST